MKGWRPRRPACTLVEGVLSAPTLAFVPRRHGGVLSGTASAARAVAKGGRKRSKRPCGADSHPPFFLSRRHGVWPLDSLIPLGEEEKPSDIPAGYKHASSRLSSSLPTHPTPRVLWTDAADGASPPFPQRQLRTPALRPLLYRHTRLRLRSIQNREIALRFALRLLSVAALGPDADALPGPWAL